MVVGERRAANRRFGRDRWGGLCGSAIPPANFSSIPRVGTDRPSGSPVQSRAGRKQESKQVVKRIAVVAAASLAGGVGIGIGQRLAGVKEQPIAVAQAALPLGSEEQTVIQ